MGAGGSKSRVHRIADMEERLLAMNTEGHAIEMLRRDSVSARSEVSRRPVKEANGRNAFETLDYDRCENSLYRSRFTGMDEKTLLHLEGFSRRYSFWRWVNVALIGTAVGLIAFVIQWLTFQISQYKFQMLSRSIESCSSRTDGCLGLPWLYGVLVNTGLVFVAAVFTYAVSPAAAGGGIAEVKATLNGVKRKGWLNMRTLVAKIFGIILGVAAGMPIGKEGPMIHIGAMVGGGIPQARSPSLGWLDLKMTMFRNDRAKRDFLAVGAAAGLSAAFGAPLAGVLFTLEEGASFLSPGLIWRSLFGAIIALFVVRLFLSATLECPSQPCTFGGLLTSGGVFSFGSFASSSQLWSLSDLGLFVVMGFGGGLLGAFWVHMQIKLARWRGIHIKTRARHLLQACFVAFVNVSLLYLAALLVGHCETVSVTELDNESVRRYLCDEEEYNDLATLVFNPLDESIKRLFMFQGKYSMTTLSVYAFVLYFTSIWTAGIMIPAGLFVPSLVIGATFGRLVGELLNEYSNYSVNAGVYSLMGSAAFTGGVTRMTIALAAMILEGTNEVSFALPLVLVLLSAKWTGDYFTESIYDAQIKLRNMPVLEWTAEEDMKRYLVSDVMSKRLVVMRPVVSVNKALRMLLQTHHNGYPVVAEDGTFLGLILRSQIITMLESRCWGVKTGDTTSQPLLTHKAFVRKYPQRIDIMNVTIPTDVDLGETFMDVTPYMNPTPYTLRPETPLPRAFNLLRTMGLRHIPILNENSRLVGLITRIDLSSQVIHRLNAAFEQRAHDNSY